MLLSNLHWVSTTTNVHLDSSHGETDPRRPLTLTPDMLRRVDSLRELDDSALLEFAAEAAGTTRDKDDEVVSHMDASRDVYFIIDGMVRVDIFHTNGMRITFQILTLSSLYRQTKTSLVVPVQGVLM
jgi:hypothetical protein